jgi:hypothetical protein
MLQLRAACVMDGNEWSPVPIAIFEENLPLPGYSSQPPNPKPFALLTELLILAVLREADGGFAKSVPGQRASIHFTCFTVCVLFVTSETSSAVLLGYLRRKFFF